MAKRILLVLAISLLLTLSLEIQSTSSTTLANSWVSRAPMSVGRSDLGVATVNGKIYAIGGNTENGYIPNSHGNDYKALGWISNVNEEYDPEKDTWTLKSPMPTARCNFAIVSFENKIYCIGGIVNWVSGLISYTGVNEVYDPATDSWETKASMPNSASVRANVVGGRIYVIGGGSNETLNQVYNPATDTWMMKKSMPTESKFLGPNALSTLLSAEVDGRIYVMSYSGYQSGTWIYSPLDDSWATLSSSPMLNFGDGWWSHAAGATTGANAAKRIYVFFEKYPYSTAPFYFTLNPSEGGWTNAGELPTKIRCFGIANVNDTLYAIGGRTYSYPYPGDNYFTVKEEATNEQYMPIGYGTPDSAPSPSPNPTPTPSVVLTPAFSPSPSVPEFSWLIILLILLAIPIVLVIIKKTVSKKVALKN